MIFGLTGVMTYVCNMLLREVLEALRQLRPKVVVFTSVPIAGSHARSAPPGNVITPAADDAAADMLSMAVTFSKGKMH